MVQRSLAQILREYDGRVKLVFKDLPLPSHPLARPAHEAARCAGVAGQYWAYHDVLFASQPAFERDQLIQYAADVGVDRDAFVRCLDERPFAGAIEADIEQARALGVSGTPTFLINGYTLVGAQPVERFRTAIEDALARKR